MDPEGLKPLPGSPSAAAVASPRRASARFMLSHPAHVIALGLGSGLSPVAPGTVGTLWAWLAFIVLNRWLDDAGWAWLLLASTIVGLWAITRTLQNLGRSDPGEVVWDEVIAFWLVLWLAMPMGLIGQILAFALFRYFDAAKPGPVGWADRLFKPADGQPPGFWQGLGVLLDDLVAALCTLLVIALWRWAVQ